MARLSLKSEDYEREDKKLRSVVLRTNERDACIAMRHFVYELAYATDHPIKDGLAVFSNVGLPYAPRTPPLGVRFFLTL